MPEFDDAPKTENDSAVQPEPSQEGWWLRSRLHVALFVVAVVAVECGIAYLYIPSAAETAALAGTTLPATPEVDAPAMIAETTDAEIEAQAEVDLGEFDVTAYQPISNTTLRISFHLFGTIRAEDRAAFDKAWQQSRHRFRDQVITIVRSSDLTELTDAGLGLIKRKILEKTNRILGKPYLHAIFFSEFSFIEQ